METYFARLSACVTTGEVVRHVLVLHPITSLWTMCKSSPEEDLDHIEMNMGWLDSHITDLNRLGEEDNRLANMLLGAHWDFDFGDEIILGENASVDNKMLRVGIRRYDTVVVPGVLSLFKTTVDLLEEFVKAGGRLIWVGAFPRMIEGRPGCLAEHVFGNAPIFRCTSFEELLGVLEQVQPREVRVEKKEGGEDTQILTMLRKTEDGYLVFAVNHDREGEHPVTFSLSVRGKVGKRGGTIRRRHGVCGYIPPRLEQDLSDPYQRSAQRGETGISIPPSPLYGSCFCRTGAGGGVFPDRSQCTDPGPLPLLPGPWRVVG